MIPFSPQWWAAQAAASGGGQSSVSTQGASQSTLALVSPVVDDCPRRSAFFQQTGGIVNSLILQGLITRTGQNSYASHTTIHQKARNPRPGDDVTQGYYPGHIWYNTVNVWVFICIDATPGAAKWPGLPAYPHDSTVPSSPSTAPSPTRTLTAGAGLTGGGDLSADRTFDVGAGTGITVNANDVALTVPVGETLGGTGQTSYTTGDILYASASNTLAKLPVGAANRFLQSDGVPGNIGWGQVSLTAAVAGTLPVANGGTARTSHTAYAVICGGTTATGAQQSVASVGTSGQVLTSNGAGALPTFETLTAGANTALSNLASVAINTDLLPDSGALRVLGSSSAYWSTGYFGDVRVIDTGLDHFLRFGCGENLSATRLLSFVVSNANRTLTIGADSSISGTAYVVGGTDVPVTDGGTGASTAAGAATNLGLGTGDSPQFTAVNVGHASDSTITRISAGVLAVEGDKITLNAVAAVLTNKDLIDSSNTYRAASDTETGALEIAVQSEMETATDTTRAVVPGRLHHHPGVPKGWVNFIGTGTVTINRSRNVSSITDGGTGIYTVVWDTDFSTTEYGCVCSGALDSGINWCHAEINDTGALATTGAGIIVVNASGSANVDSPVVTCIACGDHA